MSWTIIDSPIGPLRLVADEGPEGPALVAIEFTGPRPRTPRESSGSGEEFASAAGGGDQDDEHVVLREVARQLAAYFAGDRRDFDLPLAPPGTDFQRRVWAELCRIDYGQTRTYGQLAGSLGLTGHGARAVGVANGRNPIPIVVPCHRVVGANGTITGYAGGIDRKQALLDLEQGALFAWPAG